MNWSRIINSLFDELRDTQIRIEEDELYAFAGMIEGLRYSYRIYHENLDEFKQWATTENLPPITFPINDPQYKKTVTLFLITLSRRLFNVLSSATMYIEHSVAVKNRICKSYPDYRRSYNISVSPIVQGNEVFSFMKDLRNYFIHVSIAGFSVQYKLQERPKNVEELITRELRLDTRRLKEWQRWTEPSRRYLDSLSEDESVYSTLDEFDEILKKTYEQFAQSFKRHFHNDLRVTYMTVDRHNRIWALLDKLKEHNRRQQQRHKI